MTIKETFFVREPRQLDAIPWRAAARARAGGRARARSGSGAQPARPAKSRTRSRCSRARRSARTTPPVSILATDISTAALEGALAGRYRERSVRDVEPALRRRYFDEVGDELVVGRRLRRLVRFAPHNLARDPIPPLGEAPFDLILCRNVLIYFDGATVERVIHGLEQALRPGGMLILGSADTLCGTMRRLERLGAEPSPRYGRQEPVARVLAQAARPWGARRRPLEADALDAEASFLDRRARARGRRRRRRDRQPAACALRRPGLRARGLHAGTRARGRGRRRGRPACLWAGPAHARRRPTSATTICSSRSISKTSRLRVASGSERCDERAPRHRRRLADNSRAGHARDHEGRLRAGDRHERRRGARRHSGAPARARHPRRPDAGAERVRGLPRACARTSTLRDRT